MTYLRYAFLGIAAAMLTACATATPYQPASQPGAFDGFSQQMITDDRARITFAGNALTDRETVENYMLYRAAETALDRGFDWFELQERDTEEKKRRVVTPDRFGPYGYSRFDPYFGYSFYRPRFGWSSPYRYSRFGGFDRYRGFRNARFYDPFYDPFFERFNVREISKYRATANVRFGHGVAPEGATHIFDARQVIANLGPTLKRPEA